MARPPCVRADHRADVDDGGDHRLRVTTDRSPRADSLIRQRRGTVRSSHSWGWHNETRTGRRRGSRVRHGRGGDQRVPRAGHRMGECRPPGRPDRQPVTPCDLPACRPLPRVGRVAGGQRPRGAPRRRAAGPCSPPGADRAGPPPIRPRPRRARDLGDDRDPSRRRPSYERVGDPRRSLPGPPQVGRAAPPRRATALRGNRPSRPRHPSDPGPALPVRVSGAAGSAGRPRPSASTTTTSSDSTLPSTERLVRAGVIGDPPDGALSPTANPPGDPSWPHCPTTRNCAAAPRRW